MKIYIAGKITGEPINECKTKFAAAEQELVEAGANPVNPFSLGCPDNWTFEQCKTTCFDAIHECEGIYMLPDWKKSPGARVELHQAMKLKLHVFMAQNRDIKHITDLVKVGLVG